LVGGQNGRPTIGVIGLAIGSLERTQAFWTANQQQFKIDFFNSALQDPEK
jgi:hypothetical protein